MKTTDGNVAFESYLIAFVLIGSWWGNWVLGRPIWSLATLCVVTIVLAIFYAWRELSLVWARRIEARSLQWKAKCFFSLASVITTLNMAGLFQAFLFTGPWDTHEQAMPYVFIFYSGFLLSGSCIALSLYVHHCEKNTSCLPATEELTSQKATLDSEPSSGRRNKALYLLNIHFVILPMGPSLAFTLAGLPHIGMGFSIVLLFVGIAISGMVGSRIDELIFGIETSVQNNDKIHSY